MKTTWNDVNKPNCERAPFKVVARIEQNGKTRVQIVCPFCSNPLWAYVWSLSGSGKRCSCGALIGSTQAFLLTNAPKEFRVLNNPPKYVRDDIV